MYYQTRPIGAAGTVGSVSDFPTGLSLAWDEVVGGSSKGRDQRGFFSQASISENGSAG